MTTENLESVMRRIAKLMAIAQDDRANPAEAASAASMAEKIMRKYQLEHADIIMNSLKSGNDMGELDCVATAKTNGTKVVQVPPWCSWIAVKVAKMNECGAKIARTADGEAVVRFYGFKSDVQVAKYTFDYLVATVNRLCKAFLKTNEYKTGGRPVVNSYRHGVATGILNTMDECIRAKQAEVKQSTTGTSLMVVKAQAVAEHFGAMRTKAGRSSVRQGESFKQGVRDGRAVDVNRRGVAGGGASVLRIGN